MKSAPGCIPCVLGQVLRVAREVAEDDWLHRKVLEEAMSALPGTDWSRSPAEILTDTLGLARRTLRAQDPFAARRAEVTEALRPLADEVRQSGSFERAVLAAAAGNAVDALALGLLDAVAAVRAAMARGFAHGSAEDLRRALDPVTHVLYVLDNAGEALFDALLVEQIRALGKTVVVAARRPGLLHDATIEDARAAGLPDAIDTGQDGLLGAVPVLCGPEFRAAFEAAQLVVAKGSACYETLAGERKDAVFLLHAKCEPVARTLGVQVSDLVLLKT